MSNPTPPPKTHRVKIGVVKSTPPSSEPSGRNKAKGKGKGKRPDTLKAHDLKRRHFRDIIGNPPLAPCKFRDYKAHEPDGVDREPRTATPNQTPHPETDCRYYTPSSLLAFLKASDELAHIIRFDTANELGTPEDLALMNAWLMCLAVFKEDVARAEATIRKVEDQMLTQKCVTQNTASKASRPNGKGNGKK